MSKIISISAFFKPTVNFCITLAKTCSSVVAEPSRDAIPGLFIFSKNSPTISFALFSIAASEPLFSDPAWNSIMGMYFTLTFPDFVTTFS